MGVFYVICSKDNTFWICKCSMQNCCRKKISSRDKTWHLSRHRNPQLPPLHIHPHRDHRGQHQLWVHKITTFISHSSNNNNRRQWKQSKRDRHPLNHIMMLLEKQQVVILMFAFHFKTILLKMYEKWTNSTYSQSSRNFVQLAFCQNFSNRALLFWKKMVNGQQFQWNQNSLAMILTALYAKNAIRHFPKFYAFHISKIKFLLITSIEMCEKPNRTII